MTWIRKGKKLIIDSIQKLSKRVADVHTQVKLGESILWGLIKALEDKGVISLADVEDSRKKILSALREEALSGIKAQLSSGEALCLLYEYV